MCPHQPSCPPAERPDRDAARTIAFHPEQGWSLLLNSPDSRPLLGRFGGPEQAEAVWAEVRPARRRGWLTVGEQEALTGLGKI